MLRRLCYGILLGTILLISAIPALAQGIPDLIVPVSEVDAQTPVALIGEQQQRLDAIRMRPHARNVRLVRFANPMQVLRAHHVLLLLDGRQSVLAHTRGVTPHENGLTWIGTIGEDPELQPLTLKGEEASGRIRIGETVYLVESIGGGLHAVFTVKPDYASPLDRVGERHEEEATKTKQAASALMAGGSTNIDVLVVYTPAAASGISSMISTAATDAETSLANSNINASLTIVHQAEVNYTESGDLANDTNWLKSSSEVQTLRDQYGADIVVLVINSGSSCGIYSCNGYAAVNGAEANTSFATVRKAEMVSELLFSHEVGHLIGCLHDRESDPSSEPFPYGHGFHHKPGNWGTMMSVRLLNFSQSRLKNWSTPNKTYQGVPMGTVQHEDNARVWNERAATVAGFRSPTTPPVSVTISGPIMLGWQEQGVLTANVSGGNGTYAYRWYWRTLGSSQWVDSGVTTQQYYFTMVWTDGVEFHVDVSSGSQSGSDTHIVNYGGAFIVADGPGDETAAEQAGGFVLAQNYPNPFNPQTVIRFTLPEAAHTQLIVYDAMGREAARLLDRSMEAGFHRIPFNGADLPSGVYVYRIVAGGYSASRRMVLLR